jgi:glycosyltransferase involved in cell wall biosynthesis
MHIAINGWFWNQQTTGSGQYLRNLVTYLKKTRRDLDISLILPPHIQNPEDVPTGVTVIETGTKDKTSKLGKVWFEQRTFPKMAEQVQADIAHVPYWGTPLACSVRLVTSVLDVIPLMYPIYNQGLMTQLYTSLVSSTVRGSGHIITISETAKIDIEEQLGIPEEDISVTYLAQDERFHPRMGAEKDEAVREKYNLPDDFVLYLGGFDWRKQVNNLMLAYTYVAQAEGDNFPLVIAGKEPEWDDGLFPNLREYAKKLDIEEYIQWIGFVDEEDKPSLYRLANVYVFPSLYEGFGLMALEAMASGTPVVTSNAIVFEEVLEDAVYVVNSPRKMAGAIIALLIQEPLRDAMINQGVAMASNFSWRKTAQETIDIYEQVMKQDSN